MCSAHVYSNIRNSNNNKICLHKDTSCPNFSPNSRLAPSYKTFTYPVKILDTTKSINKTEPNNFVFTIYVRNYYTLLR